MCGGPSLRFSSPYTFRRDLKLPTQLTKCYPQRDSVNSRCLRSRSWCLHIAACFCVNCDWVYCLLVIHSISQYTHEGRSSSCLSLLMLMTTNCYIGTRHLPCTVTHISCVCASTIAHRTLCRQHYSRKVPYEDMSLHTGHNFPMIW
jgi:hypothetical protein